VFSNKTSEYNTMGMNHLKIMTDILSVVCSVVIECNFCSGAAYYVKYRLVGYRNTK